jgi:hypothetical protein
MNLTIAMTELKSLLAEHLFFKQEKIKPTTLFGFPASCNKPFHFIDGNKVLLDL